MASQNASHVYVGVARWSNSGNVSGVFRQEIGSGRFEKLAKGLPDDLQVQAVTIHPDDPNLIYLATGQGPYRSTDKGDSWEHIPLPDKDKQVWSIQVHPTRPRTLFAGTAPIAVYRSDDGGDNWRAMGDPGLPERVKMAFPCRVMRFAINPGQPDDIFATLEVNGAMRSSDNGETWKDCSRDLIKLAEQPHLKSRIGSDVDSEGMLDGHAICVSQAAPGTVYLAVRMGIFESKDGGNSWHDMEVGRFSPLTYGRDIRVSPQDPRTFYACLSPAARSEDGSVYRSRDLGRTWQRFDHSVKANSTMMGVALHPRDADTVFATSRFGQVFGTTDGGKSWSETRLPEGCRDVYAIACA
jgi:Sortilin, neurotensin receptor 3,